MLDGTKTEEAFATSIAAVRTKRDVIEVTGPDAADYLHGQLSQDVLGLEVGRSAWTLLLQPQGKIDARLRLTRLAEDRFWLDVEAGYGQASLERLQRFMLRVGAELQLLTLDLVALRGPAVADLIAGGLAAPEGGAVLEAMWPGGGVDLVGAEVAVPDGVPEGDPVALDVLRVRSGIPAMGAELDSSTIPAAAGVVDDSVDFTKGCYVGQELVARIDARGANTPTRLRGIIFGEAARPDDVPTGSELAAADTVVGHVTSFVRSERSGAMALGYVKRGVEVPSEASVVAADGTVHPVELVELPVA
ncbi:MAG: hypothetical protein OEV40_19105 [Acidimicrobiia bacterium]|nr:hypothetical protein [Acidimicrobiia bacterium]